MTPQIADTAQRFANVTLGANVVLQDWVIIGLPPKGTQMGDLETIIEEGSVIRSHTVIYAGSRIGPHFQTGHRVILGPGLDIGKHCSVGTGTVMMGYGQLQDQAKIHGHCTIGAFSILQSQAWVGPRTFLDSQPEQPCIIASGAILGAGIYVGPGCRVGERALVAAGVEITKDVPPYRLLAGSPPRALRSIERLRCPYELIDRPYESDSEAEKTTAIVTHQQRPVTEAPLGTWRHDLWQTLGRPQVLA